MGRVSVTLARRKWHFKVQEVAPEAGEEVEDYLEALLREGEVHIEGEENQYLIVRDWPSRRKQRMPKARPQKKLPTTTKPVLSSRVTMKMNQLQLLDLMHL